MKGVDNNEVVGYMITPLGLTERQLLIYHKLYGKCNFQNMTVKYTLEQLNHDIKIIDIPTKTIYKNIKNLIDKGYLKITVKASKGNAPTYRIIPINEMFLLKKEGEPKVNQERTKGELKPCNTKGLSSMLENQKRTKGEPKVYPIKEKEKENNIYSHWNSKEIIVHKSLTKDIDKAIEKALKKYSEEEIVQAIDIYAEILQSDFYFNYKWSLADFLNRKNGIDTFMEEGSNKANYNQWKSKESNNSGDDKPTKLLGWD